VGANARARLVGDKILTCQEDEKVLDTNTFGDEPAYDRSHDRSYEWAKTVDSHGGSTIMFREEITN
jgi:hypothetical protein